MVDSTLHAFESNRWSVLGRRGMVASSQPLATEAGLRILGLGGNAANAAVATAAALNVTGPNMTGIGGDVFPSTTALDPETCPRSTDPDVHRKASRAMG